MSDSRWRKMLRDLIDAPFRTALVVAAMTAGVFGVGTILTAYSILSRELATTYRDTQPASAILSSPDVSDAAIASVRRFPGVLEAEARPVIQGRIRVGRDEWKPLVLFVIRDFRDLRIDTFHRDAGAWPPADDEVLLERSGLSVARTAIGERVTTTSFDGSERSLRVAGTVHAAGLAPAWMDHVVSGFVTWRSVMRDPASQAGELRIIVRGDRLDATHIREIAQGIAASLEPRDPKLVRITIPSPGRHPHADQMETFLFLLGAFAALTLVLSAVLVANMIHALLTREVRQVGVMKALGASTRQIAALYLGEVAMMAALALAAGMPLALRGGRGYAGFAASILNATIADDSVPAWVIALQIATGLLLPLLVALTPVLRASRITIHDALRSDAGRSSFGTRPFDRWLARIRWIPRPLMLSLRTTFQRPARLALTLGTLAAGGAAFVSALNVSAAWTRTLAADASGRRYDIDVALAEKTPIARLAPLIAAIPDVARAEYWPEGRAQLDGARGHGAMHEPDGASVALLGPTPGSTLLAFPLTRGRWLAPGDRDVVVVNQTFLARIPNAHIGDRITLHVGDRTIALRLIGVVSELMPTPTGYAPANIVLAATQQQPGMTRRLRIVTRHHDAASQRETSRVLERVLAQAKINVNGIAPLSDLRKAFADHLVIIDSALLFAATLVVLVGVLGLSSALTLNVVERTRELGILGALGAAPAVIARNVVLEGTLLGALSWLAAIAAAVPITFTLDAITGRMFIRNPLDFFFSPIAAAAWLALVIILAALCSFYPAWRSTQITIREALTHE